MIIRVMPHGRFAWADMGKNGHLLLQEIPPGSIRQESAHSRRERLGEWEPGRVQGTWCKVGVLADGRCALGVGVLVEAVEGASPCGRARAGGRR